MCSNLMKEWLVQDRNIPSIPMKKVSRVIHFSKKEGRGMSPPLFFYLLTGVKLVIFA
jgi:hypothetical protein